ncbi:MAG: glycosyltransferase family 4 protein [Phycisphaerae bacterium]
MKVCHIITRLILGGAQENTLLTCEGLHRRGHEVTLVTGPAIGPEGELMRRAQRGGYRLEVIDEMRREIHPARDRATLRRLRQRLEELRPDVVHTHSSKAGILGRAAAAKTGGCKVVHTIHGLPFHPYQRWWRNRLYIALEKWAARRTDRILCVADAMTRQALAAGVGTPEQYVTVHSGMEVDRFLSRPPQADALRASLKLPSDAVLFTQVSRIAELKGHPDILAAAPLEDPRIHLCFVGDGHERLAVEKLIETGGLTGRVHLTGLLPPEQIPAVMHATDVLIHASYREGLARTLPQAMLAAKPVISYDVDGAPEVVTPETGVLVPTGNYAALGKAMSTLADDADLRRRLGSAGRELCRRRFDHERMVERIESICRKLLNE